MGSTEDSSNLTRWAEKLKGLIVTPLTRDYPEPTLDEAARTKRPIEALEILSASPSVLQALKSFHSHGTLYELLLTAYVILISRLTGEDDIAFGTNAEQDGEPFVLRTSISPEVTFIQLLEKVKEVRRVGLQSKMRAD